MTGRERTILLAPEREATHRYGLIGTPHDAPTSNARPGARYAPRALRTTFAELLAVRVDGPAHRIAEADAGVIDLSGVEVADFGDVALTHDDPAAMVAQMRAGVRAVADAGYFPLVIGGDHAITFPSVAGIHDHVAGNLGIVHFDAHADLLDENPRQGRYSGSSPIRRSIELDRVAPHNVVQIGLRGYLSVEQYEIGERLGVRRITSAQFQRRGAAQAMGDALAWATDGTSDVYLTIDIDVLDPGAAPGVGWPEPGGLTTQELSDAVRLAAPHVTAVDVAELNPSYDSRHEATLLVAARLLLDVITARAAAAAAPATDGEGVRPMT